MSTTAAATATVEQCIATIISAAERELMLVSLVSERQAYGEHPADISPAALLAWWRDEAEIQRETAGEGNDRAEGLAYADMIDSYADRLERAGVTPGTLPWEK